MDETTARELLHAAVAERDATRTTAEQARTHLYEVVREVAPYLKQVEVVTTTKWTREHIRKITHDMTGGVRSRDI